MATKKTKPEQKDSVNSSAAPKQTKNINHTENQKQKKSAVKLPQLPKMPEQNTKSAGFFEAAGIPDMILIRMISVFFLVSGVNALILRNKEAPPIGAWHGFLEKSNFNLLLAIMFLLFCGLTVLRIALPARFRFSDQIAAVTGLLLFDGAALWRCGNFYQCAGLIVVTLVFLYYILLKTDTRTFSEKLSGRMCLIITLSGTLIAFLFICLISFCRHMAFCSKWDDLGIFVQTFHSLATNGTAVTTCERAELISHFRIHASYILWLLVPFYKLIPSAKTLLFLQALFAEAGVVPLFMIAKRHKFTGIPLISICGAYTFCAAIIGPCFYDFHENAMLPTLLMWLIWSLECKKYVPAYIFAALVCIVKEDAPLFVILLCLYFFFHEKDSRRALHGFAMAGFSAAYMLLITHWLNQNGDGQFMTNSRFNHLMIEENSGLFAVLKTILVDPAYFFSLFFAQKTLTFFLEIMIPLLFTPFMTKKIYRYLLMLPFIVTNLVIGASYDAAASVDFQYIFGPICLLLYMSILNLSDMDENRRYHMPVLMCTGSLLLSFGLFTERMRWVINYRDNKQHYMNLEEMLDSFPKHAKVGVDSFLLPHAANRDDIYLFDRRALDEETQMLTHPEHFDIIVLPIDWYNEWGQEFVEKQGLVLVGQFEQMSRIYYSKAYMETNPPMPANVTAIDG